MEKYTNALVNESSPYLLQHAHNPVNWVPWADDVFERAEKEGKLVLISVGYSACHWCHVMEHESFEDEEVAALMNKFFINVKVDREERPDVDQVYMTAVQLMTQKGGWPLNCFTLPDGRPIYGGTYFPKEQWMHILKSLQHTFTNELPKVQEYAKNLHEGIIASELIDIPSEKLDFEEEKLTELMQRWSKMFDWNDGGNSRAPKFPLPSNLNFLLDYGINAKNNKAIDHVELTLDKMALGGIYDQIGGGFSRYSVDMLWKVPHFEKMLYDNGQLLSTYSKGYRQFKKPLYKRLVSQTIDWLEREMLDESGAFFSALDADSEGVEGKFYVWKKEELDAVLSKDDTWVYDFYQVNQRGYWEEDNYILLRSESDEVFAKKFGWTIEELELKIKGVNQQLLDERSSRVRPGLDNKCITSWNAMTLKGLCDAYAVFGEESYLFLALKNARWLTDNRIKEDGAVIRLEKNEQEEIEGFLEDYAHAINAFMTLYQVTLDESWLNVAKKICDYTVTHFQDAQSKMFYFTPTSTQLIARKMEINDNVISSSNSVMARNLFYLGSYFRDNDYKQQAKQMLANVYEGMEMYGSGYSNWAVLLNHYVFGCFEAIVIGGNAKYVLAKLQKESTQKVIYAGSVKATQLPLLEDKEVKAEDVIYICTEGVCHAPTSDLKEALNIIVQ